MIAIQLWRVIIAERERQTCPALHQETKKLTPVQLGCSREKTGCRRCKERGLVCEYDTARVPRNNSQSRARQSVTFKTESSAKTISPVTGPDSGGSPIEPQQGNTALEMGRSTTGGNSTRDANRQLSIFLPLLTRPREPPAARTTYSTQSTLLRILCPRPRPRPTTWHRRTRI